MPENVQDVLNDIRERIVRIETRLDDYTNLREKIDKAYGVSMNTKERLDRMEDNQKWLWRSFGGAFIASIVAWFVKFKA